MTIANCAVYRLAPKRENAAFRAPVAPMLMSARRAEHISSSGGYLRNLTDKAKAGQFSIGPACIVQRAPHINSAGGYLRVLTEKARAG